MCAWKIVEGWVGTMKMPPPEHFIPLPYDFELNETGQAVDYEALYNEGLNNFPANWN